METSVKTCEVGDNNQSSNNNNNNNNESKDEVDFVAVSKNHNNNNNDNYNNNSSKLTKANKSENVPNSPAQPKSKTAKTTQNDKPNAKERISIFSFGKKSGQKAAATTNGAEKSEHAGGAKSVSTPNGVKSKEGGGTAATPTSPRTHKFVKSTSISRLLGNTYNAKKFEKEEQKRLVASGGGPGKFNTYGGRRRANGGPQLERFKRYSKEDGDEVVSHAGAITGTATMTTDSRDLYGGTRNELVSVERSLEERHEDLGVKAMRTISRGLGKLWWKRSHSVDISTPDPEFKVSYLGNVLTGWAKGEGCVEKQLNTLWRNYTQNNKPDVIMRIKVCASGLKATTRQHGLTEYWANRITHCCAPKNYPRVFCWIYRHEGRKLKHELRCHAVLCSKERVVQDICNTLKDNLESALREFKREKILRQNARLSLANAVYDNPSLPRRKILLSVGGNNYRPPLERSKSAPKLMAIEEAIGEEEGEEIEETNEPEMRACCQKDSLYPAMTLGRRRCRRGHSIRRTGKTRPSFDCAANESGGGGGGGGECCQTRTKEEPHCVDVASVKEEEDEHQEVEEEEVVHNSSDDSDDFEKVLKHNNYDSSASLANELMPYFDMSLHKNTSCSLGSLSELKDEYEEPMSLQHTINSDPNAAVVDYQTEDEEEDHPGLRRNGVCSDGEEDYLDGEDDLYFRQASILNMLHRNSMRKMAHLSLSSDESSSLDTNASSTNHASTTHGSADDGGSNALQYRHQMQSSISSDASSTVSGNAGSKHHQHNGDSDEGSISSGCETASTVTANQDDLSLNYRPSQQEQMSVNASGGVAGSDFRQLMNDPVLFMQEPPPVSAEEIYQRLESRLQKRHNSDATTFSSSSSITLKMGNGSSTASVSGGLDLDDSDGAVGTHVGGRRSSSRRHSSQPEQRDFSDSECSDESGYVEFQGKEQRARDLNGHGEDVASVENVQKEKKLATATMTMNKPQPPPKPMPRRLLTTVKANTTTTV